MFKSTLCKSDRKRFWAPERGFTLIELIVVVIIVGILASVSLPLYNKVVEKSRTAEPLSMLKSILDSQMRLALQNEDYAASLAGLDINITDPAKFFHYELGNAAVGGNNNQTIARAIRLPDAEYKIWITELGYFGTNNLAGVVPGAEMMASEPIL